MENIKKVFGLKDIGMGFTFMLVNLASVVAVTSMMGLSISSALFMTGVNTILFFFLTKGKLMSVLGISGLYTIAIPMITEKYGVEYTCGAIVLAGVLYCILGMLVKACKLLKYIPKYIMSFGVILIGLSLIPIATILMSGNIYIGLFTMLVMIVIEFKCKGVVRLFSLPISIAIGSAVYFAIFGFNLSTAIQPMTFIIPKFNLESFLTVSIIALSVVFENVGDCKNVGDILHMDVDKEVGFHRTIIANGICSILNGFVGAAPATTYSEQSSAILITGYRKKAVVLITGIFFILLSFIKPFSSLMLTIPNEVLGGSLLFLYGSVVVNAIKQVLESDINLATDRKAFIIMSTMIGLFYITYTIGGLSISSIAISMVVGIIMHNIIRGKNKEV